MKPENHQQSQRIAIIADPLDNQSAGVHVFTKGLIDAIIKLGEADRFLLIRQKVDPQLPIAQIAIPNTKLPIGYASLRLFFIIPYILRKQKVSAVFEPAHFGPFNLPKRIKRITMIHDLTPLLFPHFHPWHSQILQRIFLPLILRKTDWILTNSKYTQQDVEEYFPSRKQKISHLYLGKHQSFVPTTNQTRIEELGIDAPYFLFVGTLEPRKNLLLLLNVFKTFCIKNSSNLIQLVFVGNIGWKSKELMQALAQYPQKNRIKQLGFVAANDLPILYTHAKALIYPSQYEGFGLPIIEAMACGTNVIAAKNSSLVEIGEEAAFFFETHSEADLLKQMEEVLINPFTADRLVDHARQFSWEDCAQSFLMCCNQVVGE